MHNLLRPLALSIALALAANAQAAKPARPAKVEATPVAKAEVEFAHNLGEVGEDRLQAVVDRFNKESKAGVIKLVRLERGDKPAVLNLVRRYDMDEVLRQPGRRLHGNARPGRSQREFERQGFVG